MTIIAMTSMTMATRNLQKKHSGHDHSGHNHAALTNFGQAFIIAIALNTTYVVVEFGYGIVANSTALMGDEYD